ARDGLVQLLGGGQSAPVPHDLSRVVNTSRRVHADRARRENVLSGRAQAAINIYPTEFFLGMLLNQLTETAFHLIDGLEHHVKLAWQEQPQQTDVLAAIPVHASVLQHRVGLRSSWVSAVVTHEQILNSYSAP